MINNKIKEVIMNSAVIGFPRVGKLRELKFASEKYFRGEISKTQLTETAKKIKAENWKCQKEQGIKYISSNDFSYYDGMLDTAVLLGVVPECYKNLNQDALDTYFAMARGYQGEEGDVPALAMKKWFNTNYHYIEPELGADTKISLTGTKPFDEYLEAQAEGIQTKPVLIGPFTFLKLARYQDGKKATDFVEDICKAYSESLAKFVQFPPSALENCEKLEQLRALENGMRIYALIVPSVKLIEEAPADINTPEELAEAQKFLF